MLNKNKERELAYIVCIDNILPIDGADKVEIAIVNGWHIMVRKQQFQIGDLAVYFEIDSKVPEKEPFMFLQDKHFKIKTQKYFKGTVISQGLLMSLEDFPDIFEEDRVSNNGWIYKDIKDKKLANQCVQVGDFLTKILQVKYSVKEDNERKGKGPDKYSKMAARHKKLFTHNKLVMWLYKRVWGKRLLFIFLGKKKDKRGWPQWVQKTDEERVQNLPNLFPEDKRTWIVTEKIDGTSTTFTLRKNKRQLDYYVCSRNVCFDTPEKQDKCYYDSNVYLEMNEKYDIQQKLTEILKNTSNTVFITLQGETYGKDIQKRTYNLQEHKFMAFNLIFGYKDGTSERLNPIEMKKVLDNYNIPCVPIIDTNFVLPKSCDQMLEYAGGPSKIDGELREGVVLRTLDGANSFKAVDNNFLIKYHE